jgi:hypothetical protein
MALAIGDRNSERYCHTEIRRASGEPAMSKLYVAISAIIFALVAVGHIVRIVQGWQVQLGAADIPMSVSWIALVVTAALALWGGTLLRR